MAPKPEEIPVGTAVGNDDALRAVAGTMLKVCNIIMIILNSPYHEKLVLIILLLL